MESVDELRRSIKSKRLEMKKQQEVLKGAEHDVEAVKQRLTNAKDSMRGHCRRIEDLIDERMELEKALRLSKVEIEILKECARKERAELIALRDEEVAKYQEKLESAKQELEQEREKIPLFKEEIQQLLVELARKSEEIRHLKNSLEEANSQLKIEREKEEMNTKQLTAIAVSYAKYMEESQVRS